MPTDKNHTIELHRDYYPLPEAAELARLKVDDLLHLAAQGKLNVSVITDSWEIGTVYQIDRSPDCENGQAGGSHIGSEPVEFPEPGDQEFQAKFQASQQSNKKRDLVIGRHWIYGRQGQFARLYSLPLQGLQPVSYVSFGDFLICPSTAVIRLDLNRILGTADSEFDRIILPSPLVCVQDAVAAEKLVVLKNDLHRVISGDQTSPDDVKVDGGVSRKTLLKLVIGLAQEGYSYDPSRKKNDAVGDIHKDLQVADVGLDADSIRKALREAALLLPGNPQKD